MRYIISGKNLEITDGLRSAVTEKLGKLERYFTPDTEVHVTLSVEKERQKIEVTIPVKGNIIRSEQSSTDMYVSIDLVEEVIERQLRKYKNKLIARHQDGGNFRQEFMDKEAEDQDVQIIRSKKFDIKPMYPEDACVQMELLGHSFFAFVNAETVRSMWFIREKAALTVFWSRMYKVLIGQAGDLAYAKSSFFVS